MNTTNLPFTASPGPERSRWYMGGLLTFLAKGSDTNGLFSLTETLMRKGLEPPSHMHSREDETFYVLDGEITFYTEGQEHNLKAGESIYLPRDKPHYFKIVTPTARYLLLIAPAGLEEMFYGLSVPAQAVELPPPPAGPPPAELIARIQALQVQYGIQMKEVPKGFS